MTIAELCALFITRVYSKSPCAFVLKEMKLSELKFGQEALVEKINDNELSLKLLEMGLLPGEIVALENIAPFGDPIAIRVGEYKMCLRLDDAACVEVFLK